MTTCDILLYLNDVFLCPNGGNGNVECLFSYFFFLFYLILCEAEQSVAATSELYSLFFLIVVDDKGNLAFVFLIIIILWNRSHGWIISCSYSPGCAKKKKKVKYDWKIDLQKFSS